MSERKDFVEITVRIGTGSKAAEAALVDWMSAPDGTRPALEKLLALARERAEVEEKKAQCVTDAAEIMEFFGALERHPGRSGQITECCGNPDGENCSDCPELTPESTLENLHKRLCKLEQGGLPLGRIKVEVDDSAAVALDGQGFKRKVGRIAGNRSALR